MTLRDTDGIKISNRNFKVGSSGERREMSGYECTRMRGRSGGVRMAGDGGTSVRAPSRSSSIYYHQLVYTSPLGWVGSWGRAYFESNAKIQAF